MRKSSGQRADNLTSNRNIFNWGVEMESVETVVGVISRTILACHEEAGRPRAVWIKPSEIAHMTGGPLPGFLVEKIREALAMQSLVFAEVAGVGFLLIDPAKFPAKETPHLTLTPSIHRRVPVPQEVPAPQGIVGSLGDFYSAGDGESTQR